METIDVVSIDRAAALIGGDKPVSRSTVQRMIAAGVLDARGKGQLRRVTLRSINAYNSGETTWHGDVHRGAAARFKTATASGGQKSPSPTGARAALVVLTGRVPRPR